MIDDYVPLDINMADVSTHCSCQATIEWAVGSPKAGSKKKKGIICRSEKQVDCFAVCGLN